MSKIKNLSDLGALYGTIQEAASKLPAIEAGNKQPDILLTDATQYLPESAPKVGSAFGKDSGKEELVKGTGPEAAKGFNKKEAKEKQEAAKETKQEEADMEAAEKNEETPEKEEKVEENVDSASKTPKYKKQTFTMPKSKFQKLYEDAVNGVPFVKEEEEVAPIAPAADHEMGGEEPAMGGEHEEEAACTHEEAIEMVEKLLKFLKKDMEHDIETDTLGDEDQGAGEDEESAMGEAIDAEEMGHALVDGKSEELKDGHKMHKVGSLKAKGAASEQGGPKGQDGAAKKQPDSGMTKDGHKLHTVGNHKVDKGQSNMFEQ
jgi:hypothetical protein